MSIEYIQALIAALGGLGGIGAALRWAWVRLEQRTDTRIKDLEFAAAREREALDKERTAAVERLERIISGLQDRVTRLETELHERDALLPGISAWIGMAMERAGKAGVQLPEPPPIFPSRRSG